MVSLPTVGGDNNSWGSELNAFLQVGHNSDGTNIGLTGPTGATGPAGGGGAGFEQYQLNSGLSAGDTSVVLDRSVTGAVKAQGWLVIDAFTSQAEICKINSVSGATVTLTSGVKYAHIANDYVLSLVGPGTLPAGIWNCVGDGSTDDTTALQEAIDQTSKTSVQFWLDGRNKTFGISQPLACSISARLRSMQIKALSGYAPGDTNNAMIMSSQGSGPLAFTADASTDVLTATAHGINGTDSQVMVKGSALPGGLVSGRVYYAKTVTTNTFQLAATAGGSAIDITSAGSGGFAYVNLLSLEKIYLDDVYLNINLQTGVNGAMLCLQQPAWTRGLRIDSPSSTSTCLWLRGQISNHFSSEINGISNGDGSVLVDLDGVGHNFYGINLVHGSVGVYVRSGQSITACSLNGLWTEVMATGVRLSGTTLGLVINGWEQSFGSVSDVSLLVEVSGTAYTITGSRGNNGSNTIINDTARGYSILDSAFAAGVITRFSQENGNVAPELTRVPASKSADYTATMTDEVIRGNAGSAPITITLPTAVLSGKRYSIIKSDATANTVTIATTSSQTINGASTYTLSAQFAAVTVVSASSGWQILNTYP